MKTVSPSSLNGESPFDIVKALSRKRGGEIRIIDESDVRDIADLQWQSHEVIERDRTAGDFAPHLATNSAGQGMAIWCKHDGTAVQLWTRHYSEEHGWAQTQPIWTDGAVGIGFPQIAMDARGCVIAVWRRFIEPSSSIWVSRYVPHGGWSRPTLVRQESQGEVFDPRIAMNERGDAMVVWQYSSAECNSVWTCRHVAGVGWEQPAMASNHGASDASAPRVAIDASGNAMVVWRQFDGTSTSIWANLYDIHRGWGVAAVLDVEEGGTAFDAQIVMAPSGNAIAMWTHTRRQHSCIYASHYLVGKGWGRSARVGAGSDKAALLPQLAMDARGNAVAVWGERDGKRISAYSSRYQAGAAWSKPSRIDRESVSGAGSSFDPKLAMDAQGNAVAVWQQVNGVQRSIWASRYQADAGWSGAHQLKSPDGGDAFEPQISMSRNGRALALWQTWSESHFSVLASVCR